MVRADSRPTDPALGRFKAPGRLIRPPRAPAPPNAPFARSAQCRSALSVPPWIPESTADLIPPPIVLWEMSVATPTPLSALTVEERATTPVTGARTIARGVFLLVGA